MNTFAKYIKSKYKFAQMYANQISRFSEADFRSNVFSIKSHLTGDHITDDKVYMPINLGRRITNTFADYIIGQGTIVDFGTKEVNDKFTKIRDTLSLHIKLNDAIKQQSSIGYGILRKRKVNKQIKIELIPVTNYSAKMEGLTIGSDFLDIPEHYVFSVVDRQEGGMNKKVMIVDRYTKMDTGRKGFYGEEYDFSGSFNLSTQKTSAKSEESLTELPLYLFNNDLSNPTAIDDIVSKESGFGIIPKYFNQSDYVDLADLFQEINDRESQISIEFIKNLTSKMSVPASFGGSVTANAHKPYNKEEDCKSSRRGGTTTISPDWITHGAGETPATYITKDANLSTLAIKDYIPQLVRFISAISTVPVTLLGLDALFGNSPVGTITKEFEPFYKRIGQKQQMIYSTLQRLFRDIMVDEGNKVDLPTIKFPILNVSDQSSLTNTALAHLGAGLMSKKEAIKYVRGLDNTEAQEILDEVAKESKNEVAIRGSLISNKENDVE